MIQLCRKFGRELTSWISIQSITATSIQLRYGLPDCASCVRAELTGGGLTRTQIQKGNSAGQIRFEQLAEATSYRIQFNAGADTIVLEAATPTAPRSPKYFTLALMADPHLSSGGENLHGRLHVESAMLLQGQLSKAIQRGCDLILFPGDVTDEGRPEEYRQLETILRAVTTPFLATPGNHDLGNDHGDCFRGIFGDAAFLHTYRGFQLAALDTSDELLDKAANRRVIEALDPARPVILMTHYQLFADEWIPDANRVVADAAACTELLDKLAACTGMLYVGHKNVASTVCRGRLRQLNLPQLTHFPAGYLEASFYEEGVWHTFMPIESEVLNEYSRLGTEAACYHSHPQCSTKSAYRDAHTQHDWNQVVHYELSAQLAQ